MIAQACPIREPQTASFFSEQVVRGDYFVLDLEPKKSTDLTVACGGSELCKPNYCVDRESFKYYGIEFVAEGECDLTLNGNTHHLKPGSIFCYGPTTSHRLESKTKGRLLKFFVDLHGKSVPDILWSTFFENETPYHISQYRWIHDVFLQLMDSGQKGGPAAQKICCLLIEILLERIHQLSLSTHKPVSPAQSTYERCRSYLSDNFRTIRSVDELAQDCRVTRIRLSRLFKRFGRRSPSEILIQYKMTHAADLLMSGIFMIKKVAESVGYNDPYYFSRAFKHYYGVSPRDFRREHGGENATEGEARGSSPRSDQTRQMRKAS